MLNLKLCYWKYINFFFINKRFKEYAKGYYKYCIKVYLFYTSQYCYLMLCRLDKIVLNSFTLKWKVNKNLHYEVMYIELYHMQYTHLLHISWLWKLSKYLCWDKWFTLILLLCYCLPWNCNARFNRRFNSRFNNCFNNPFCSLG